MRTCSAQIANRAGARVGRQPVSPLTQRRGGFTLIEMIVVLSMLALFTMVAQVNLFGMLRRTEFSGQVQGFISTMQMAASAAAETGRRYEVIVDIGQQSYLLRQITSSNLADVKQEEIITEGQFGSNCRIVYVAFDDGEATNEGQAKFRAGRAGWQYGGKVVFRDNAEQLHTVAVGRLTPVVELIQGDPELMRPKARDEVPFL